MLDEPVKGIAIEGKLREAGYELVPFGDTSGVINTCTVTNEADAKSRMPFADFLEKS